MSQVQSTDASEDARDGQNGQADREHACGSHEQVISAKKVCTQGELHEATGLWRRAWSERVKTKE